MNPCEWLAGFLVSRVCLYNITMSYIWTVWMGGAGMCMVSVTADGRTTAVAECFDPMACVWNGLAGSNLAVHFP